MAEPKRRARRRRAAEPELPLPFLPGGGGHDALPVPAAMPGPRTQRERAMALTVAASFLVAVSSLGMGRAPAPTAPDCPPSAPGEVSWYDPDGCWERTPEGGRRFRTTTTTGVRTYHASPPSQSRYWERQGRSRWSFWSSSRGSSSGSSYRGSGSAAG